MDQGNPMNFEEKMQTHQWDQSHAPEIVRLFLALQWAQAQSTAGMKPVLAEFGLSTAEFDVLATLRNATAPYSLLPGEIQKAVNASNEARKKAVATRREILLGTNQFPNFNEVAAEKIQNEAAGCCCGGGHNCGEATITALDFSRGASEFEALRLATEKSGKTPKVFMLTIGNLAMRLARSQFSSNFFACAGYKVIDN